MSTLWTILVIGVLLFLIYQGYKVLGGGRQRISDAHVPESFVVLDLETTGLDASKHEIIEIGAIRYRRGQTTHETFQALVKPKRKIPKRITEITGITQEMVERDGDELPIALAGLHAFIGSAPVVAFNAKFDMEFLAQAAVTCQVNQLRNSVSCALELARRAWPGRGSYKLDALAQSGGFDKQGAHRALEDARRALIVYVAASAELR